MNFPEEIEIYTKHNKNYLNIYVNDIKLLFATLNFKTQYLYLRTSESELVNKDVYFIEELLNIRFHKNFHESDFLYGGMVIHEQSFFKIGIFNSHITIQNTKIKLEDLNKRVCLRKLNSL